MKLAEVKPLIDELVDGVMSARDLATREVQVADIRIALESAFVAGVRSGLKYTSNAKFAEVFGGNRSDK